MIRLFVFIFCRILPFLVFDKMKWSANNKLKGKYDSLYHSYSVRILELNYFFRWLYVFPKNSKILLEFCHLLPQFRKPIKPKYLKYFNVKLPFRQFTGVFRQHYWLVILVSERGLLRTSNFAQNKNFLQLSFEKQKMFANKRKISATSGPLLQSFLYFIRFFDEIFWKCSTFLTFRKQLKFSLVYSQYIFELFYFYIRVPI